MLQAIITGLISVAMTLATSELLAGLHSMFPSMIVAIGSLLIDYSPPLAKDLVINMFGANDKIAVIASSVLGIILIGGVIGILTGRKVHVGIIGFSSLGTLGVLAAIRDPQFALVPILISTGISTVVGWFTLSQTLPKRVVRMSLAGHDDAPEEGLKRRAFMVRAGSLITVTGGLAIAGRLLTERSSAALSHRKAIILPQPSELATRPSSQKLLNVAGLKPFVTPNNDFYRVDTSLSFPRVDPNSWSLRITGMVDNTFELTFDELLRMEMVERYVTLACVSNRVGGNLVGNAKWLGVPVEALLNMAGVRQGANQIVGRGVDGFTAGFPTETAFDGRSALVAVGMNGTALPFDHGFPARLVVPGLYGYVSATKWLTEIELTTLGAFDAYWVPRGWAKHAPIKTQSRIDVPQPVSKLGPGRQWSAGSAWAPSRSIEKVEVQLDDQPWARTHLEALLTKEAWRRWAYDFEASSGKHVLRVRATDGEGRTQTSRVQDPRPDGATGYHSVQFLVG